MYLGGTQSVPSGNANQTPLACKVRTLRINWKALATYFNLKVICKADVLPEPVMSEHRIAVAAAYAPYTGLESDISLWRKLVHTSKSFMNLESWLCFKHACSRVNWGLEAD